MNNNLEHNSDYIKHKVGNAPGFSVPEDYFNGIEDDFTLKLTEEQLPNNTSFEVPDSYFDNLEAELTAKTKPKKGKVISLKERIIRFIPATVAASIVLFIGLHFFNTTVITPSIEDISSIDIEKWFDENTIYTDTELSFSFEDDLEEYELAEVSFDDEAIEDYLQTIDDTDLLNEIQ